MNPTNNNNKYSDFLENELWDAAGADINQDYNLAELIDYINSRDFFRSFSERILALRQNPTMKI